MKESVKIMRCKKCLMPNTRPNSIFDSEKIICQACKNYEKRESVDWDKRYEELEKICNKYKKNNRHYDCLIPVSGGKDSYYLAYIIKEKMGMNPLLLTVMDAFTHTLTGTNNLKNLIEVFKLNHYQYTINQDLFRRATRTAFENTGEPLRFIENSIYTIPVLFAQKFDIPLVVFGENSSFEYGEVQDNFYLAMPQINKISCQLEKNKSWWAERGVEKEEVSSIQIDKSKSFPEVIYMSYFSPWSSLNNFKIAKKYGFIDLTNEWKRDGCIDDFEQIDSIGYMVHHWLKYPKFGFQRASDIASRYVREGELDLFTAKKLIIEKDHKLDKRALEDFLNFLGYTNQEFWDIVEKFWNRDIFEKINGVWIPKFFYDR